MKSRSHLVIGAGMPELAEIPLVEHKKLDMKGAGSGDWL
jgi:hypothetical protein